MRFFQARRYIRGPSCSAPGTPTSSHPRHPRAAFGQASIRPISVDETEEAKGYGYTSRSPSLQLIPDRAGGRTARHAADATGRAGRHPGSGAGCVFVDVRREAVLHRGQHGVHHPGQEYHPGTRTQSHQPARAHAGQQIPLRISRHAGAHGGTVSDRRHERRYARLHRHEVGRGRLLRPGKRPVGTGPGAVGDRTLSDQSAAGRLRSPGHVRGPLPVLLAADPAVHRAGDAQSGPVAQLLVPRRSGGHDVGVLRAQRGRHPRGRRHLVRAAAAAVQNGPDHGRRSRRDRPALVAAESVRGVGVVLSAAAHLGEPVLPRTRRSGSGRLRRALEVQRPRLSDTRSRELCTPVGGHRSRWQPGSRRGTLSSVSAPHSSLSWRSTRPICVCGEDSICSSSTTPSC